MKQWPNSQDFFLALRNKFSSTIEEIFVFFGALGYCFPTYDSWTLGGFCILGWGRSQKNIVIKIFLNAVKAKTNKKGKNKIKNLKEHAHRKIKKKKQGTSTCSDPAAEGQKKVRVCCTS